MGVVVGWWGWRVQGGQDRKEPGSVFMGSKSAWQFSALSQSLFDYPTPRPPGKGGLCRRASPLSLITPPGLPRGDYTHQAMIDQGRGCHGLSLFLSGCRGKDHLMDL